jgi:GntR family transcriptional regulator, sialic acid-inducible nan operon repressor
MRVEPDIAAEIAATLDGRRIDRRRLYEEVAGRIEALIASGRLRPGDKLPSERELTGLFGVGRTSIREALFSLQRKGIVAAQAGGRPVVSVPKADVIVSELSGAVRYFLASERGTREFQHARRLFEPALARDAARAATKADVARLAAALAANEAALGDATRFVETDVAFHYAIVEITRSELLVALHRAVLGWLREQRTSSIAPRGSSQAAYRAHRRIFEAIAARDPDRAEGAMRAHLEEVEKFYCKARGPAGP